MSRVLMVLMVVVLLAGAVQGQAPDTLWVRTYDGTAHAADGIWSSVVDASGSVYCLGWSDGVGSNLDLMVVKYSSSGDLLWTYRYDGPANGQDDINLYTINKTIAVSDDGSTYFTARSTGTTSGFDLVTVKLQADGSEEWVHRYNGPGNGGDEGMAIVIDGAGNIIVAGITWTGANYSDYITIKYRPDGNIVWTRTYNGPPGFYDDAYSVVVDSEDNIYVSGASQTSGSAGGGWYDVATIKYDSSGNQIWLNRYGDAALDNDGIPLIKFDQQGNLFAGSSSVGNGTDFDYLIIKYNGTGGIHWTRRYDGPVSGEDHLYSMDFDESGAIYVTGESDGAGTNSDAATLKYSADGTLEWIERFNGSGNWSDAGNQVLLNSLGGVLVAGLAYGSGTGYDLFLSEYSQAGELQWTVLYTSSGSNREVCTSLNLNDDGSIIATGMTAATGDDDFLTIKYICQADSDIDGVVDCVDNCPDIFNPGQEDTDLNDIGDHCQYGFTDTGSVVQVSLEPWSFSFDSVSSLGVTFSEMVSPTHDILWHYRLVPTFPDVHWSNTTTAVYEGQISLCYNYDEDDPMEPEHLMKMMYWDESDGWIDITTVVDTVVNEVCGEVSSLSTFITVEPCCSGIRGDLDESGAMDVADLTFLVDYLFGGGAAPGCPVQADINGSDSIDVADLTYVVDYLFAGGPAPVNCPPIE